MSEEVEQEARKEGWVPQDEWKGDPEKWKPAEKFVEDGKNINGILRSKVDRLEERVEQLLDSNKQLNEFSQRTIEKERKEKTSLINELKAARKQAVTDGDGDAYERANDQIQNLQEDLRPAPEKLDPVAQTWLRENSWYESNRKLHAFADGVADQLIESGYVPGSKAYFDELTSQVKETFPEEFENKNRGGAAAVETPGKESKKDSEAKTFDNLPPEAKAQFEIFKRDIPNFSKEDYVDNYDWE